MACFGPTEPESPRYKTNSVATTLHSPNILNWQNISTPLPIGSQQTMLILYKYNTIYNKYLFFFVFTVCTISVTSLLLLDTRFVHREEECVCRCRIIKLHALSYNDAFCPPHMNNNNNNTNRTLVIFVGRSFPFSSFNSYFRAEKKYFVCIHNTVVCANTLPLVISRCEHVAHTHALAQRSVRTFQPNTMLAPQQNTGQSLKNVIFHWINT